MAQEALQLTNLTPTELEDALVKYGSDIEAFARDFFPHLLNKSVPEFHKEIYRDLLKPSYYACAAPRGHAKSTIGLIIKPIHFALFNDLGDITLLSASESFIVNEITRRIKFEFENNENLISIFGNQRTSKWAETYFVLKNGVAFEAGGIGGQLRGGRRGLIALDDLETNETVESEEQRAKLRDRVKKELIPKLIPGGQLIYFGTIISPLCYLNTIISTPDNGWDKRFYAAYWDLKNKCMLPQAKGNELWAEMLPHEELQRRKQAQGTNAFSSEYLNTPVSDETQPIKEDQIRYWKEFPTQYSSVITVDPAYSDDEKADFKTCLHTAIDQQMNRYSASYVRTHQPIGEFQDAILNLWLQNKNTVTAIGIPNSGVEKAFFDSFLKKCEERKLYPPVVELKNSFTQTGTSISIRGKKARVTAALQPLFEQGKYFISPNHIELREELLTIGSSRWDDLVDCAAYAEQILQPYFDGGMEVNEKGDYIKQKHYNNYGMD